MHREEFELIQSRALNALDAAKQRYDKEDYDLAAFLSEQSVQLLLKSIILKMTGEMPRIHSIRQLLGVLREICPRKKDQIDLFAQENRSLLIRLEEAYLASRYLFRKYSEEEARELIEFSERVFEFAKLILSDC